MSKRVDLMIIAACCVDADVDIDGGNLSQLGLKFANFGFIQLKFGSASKKVRHGNPNFNEKRD